MKRVERHIAKLETKIAEMFKGDVSGHSSDHLRRALNYALELQKHEGGDIEVIAVATFIHDVHRLMENEKGKYVQPVESLPKIKELIADLELTDKQQDHICHCIEFHEQYNFGNNPVTVTDIESLIVQDADNLDAVGVIAITRCIQYTLKNGGVLYDPSYPLYHDDDWNDTKFDKTVVHHIHNKLIRLGTHMNTKTALEIAKPKVKIMQDFIDMFMQEWK